MRTEIKNKAAFTLPEVLVASALLVIAIVPILKALAQINMNTALIERRTRSLCLAKTQVNELQAESIRNFDKSFSQKNIHIEDLYLCTVASQTVNTNLKAFTVSVGMDKNKNGVLAADEVEITLQTQIARR